MLLILIALLWAVPAEAACTGSSPTWTSTLDVASVSTCVTNATAGDTINVSAGSQTWSSSLTMNKNVSLIGAGIGNSVVTINTGTAVNAQPTNSTTNLFRISGFTFTTSGTNSWMTLRPASNVNPPVTMVRIDHNRCDGTSTFTGSCIIHGSVRGVIDHNQFVTQRPHRAQKAGDEGAYDWATYGPMTPGTSDDLYFEDNTYDLGNAGYMLSDGFDGCRYAYRYNSITANVSVDPFFDWHGTNGTSHGCFAGEIYGNKWLSNSGRLVSWRGGKARVFLNQAGTGFDLAIYSQQACPNVNERHNDGYIWGNRKGVAGAIVGQDIPGGGGDVCGDVFGQQNVTYWSDTVTDESSMGGGVGGGVSQGVRTGTLAAIPGTCTVGQGYWATNQSTTNLTGMVGPNPATPISGTLYKCTSANVWSSYYTPYTYPHPLVSGVPSPPAAPTNLRFQ